MSKLLLLGLFLLIGCGKTKPRDYVYVLDEVCLNGFVYYSGSRNLAPKFIESSKIEKCSLPVTIVGEKWDD